MNFWSRIPCITLPKCRGTSPQEPRGPCLCGLAPLPRRCEAKLSPAQLPGCGAQGHLDGTGAATAAAGLSVSSYLRPIPPSSRPGCLRQCGVPRRTEREPVRPGPGPRSLGDLGYFRGCLRPQAGADPAESPALTASVGLSTCPCAAGG